MDKFIVTIARGFGSGGRTIGKMLADKLGVKFYDKDLIRMASDVSGINEALFGQSDARSSPRVNPDSFPRRICSTTRRW